MTCIEIMKHLVAIAQKYDWNDIKVYIAEIGWEPEWMCDYMEDPEAETLSIYDNRRINNMLVSAFEIAHNKRFNRTTCRDLLDY